MTLPIPYKPRRGDIRVRTRTNIHMTKRELRELLNKVHDDSFMAGFEFADTWPETLSNKLVRKYSEDPLSAQPVRRERRGYVNKIVEKYSR